ncbi:MAG: hypothetical protein Q8P67_04705, partial [archaeon]|nr:hypothetical protein [archaeon]
MSGCGTPTPSTPTTATTPTTTATTPTTTFPTPEGLVPTVEVINVEQVPSVDLNAANSSEVVVENGQTILERAAACVAELTDEMKEAIRGAGAVVFIGHSQGGPVSVMLASHLLFGGLEIDEEATNQPPLVDLNRQRVLLLSLSGVHNGSLEKYASVPYLNRPATRELALMADPSYPFFCGTYLPRLTRLLEAGARMVAVHSHNDSAVSVGSATIDGLDHPRLLRFAWLHPRFEAAARQHRRWRSGAGDPQAWLRDYDGRLGSGFMLGLLEYVLRRRNQGHTDDLARFLQRSPYSATLLQTLPSIFSDLRSVWNSKGTDDFRGTLFRAASKTLSSSASVWQDLEAHKHVDDCPSVYQLGISALLSPSLATPSPSLSVRPTFDLSPAHPQEWNRFVSLLLSLPAVDPLRYAFAASLSSADSDLPEPLSQALSAFHFETPPPLHALLEPLHASFPAVPHRQLLKLLVDNRLDSLRVRQLIEHQQR